MFPKRPVCSARSLAASACLLWCIASWVAMAELLTDLQDEYSKPYFMRYLLLAYNSLMGIPYLVARARGWCEGGALGGAAQEAGANPELSRPLWRRLLNPLTVAMTFLNFSVGYVWYWSMQYTNP